VHGGLQKFGSAWIFFQNERNVLDAGCDIASTASGDEDFFPESSVSA
jgi:hypothetical protein